MNVSLDLLVTGGITGLAYALLGTGLILIYRATRVFNFAHGETGALAAALLAKLVMDLDVPYPVGVLVALVVGAAIGALTELTVMRRLARSSRLVMLVATIGVSQLLLFLQFLVPGVERGGRYPTAFESRFEIAGVLLRSDHLTLLLVAPALMLGLFVFLDRTTLGRDIRAAADNPDAARLAGVRVQRVSTAVWTIAGAFAAVSFVLINPIRATVVGAVSVAAGPSLLVRALVPVLLARFGSLRVTLIGGVAYGAAEALLLVNVADPGIIEVVTLGIVAALLVRDWRRQRTDIDIADTQLPAAAADTADTPRLRRRSVVALGALTVAAPFVFSSPSQNFLLSRIAVYVVIALSVTVLTGWAGQLSLGQFALVGLGAMATVALTNRGMPLGPALVNATVAGAAAAFLLGGPALRVRGIHLALITMAFAVAASGYLLTHDILTSGDTVVSMSRGSLGPFDLSSQRTYYFLCLALAAASVAAVARLRRTGTARAIIAVRDNEPAAAAYGIHPTITKLAAFTLSGALAGLGGGLLAGLQVQFAPSLFSPAESLRILSMVIIGGLQSVGGAILGALWVIGLPAFISESPEIRFLTSGLGLLVLLMYAPGGLLQVANAMRRAVAAALHSNRSATPAVPALPPAPSTTTEATGTADLTVTERPHPAEPHLADLPAALQVTDISVGFGGLIALDGVSIHALEGETVALVGANGAGKTTLVNVIAGSLQPRAGRVELFDVDVSDAPAHVRAHLGVGRIFQNAGLFGQLTVVEALLVAADAADPTELVPGMLGLPPARRAEHRKRADAAELIGHLGLGPYAYLTINALSTGTRRVVELAALVVHSPRLILADEPTAGLAQREAEAFVPLMQQVTADLGATTIIIEHDIPLTVSISDRMYCLNAGKVIADGDPLQVISDPAVIATYLGTDERAVARSGPLDRGPPVRPTAADLATTDGSAELAPTPDAYNPSP